MRYALLMGSTWVLTLLLAVNPPDESQPDELRPEGPMPLPEVSEEMQAFMLPSELGVETVVDDPTVKVNPKIPRLELDPTPRDLRPPNWALGWEWPELALVLRPLDYRTEFGESRAMALGRPALQKSLMSGTPILMPLAGGVGRVDDNAFDPGGAGVSLTLEWSLWRKARRQRDRERARLAPRMGLFATVQAQSGGLPEGQGPTGSELPAGVGIMGGLYFRF